MDHAKNAQTLRFQAEMVKAVRRFLANTEKR